jgi:hypothetical protein
VLSQRPIGWAGKKLVNWHKIWNFVPIGRLTCQAPAVIFLCGSSQWLALFSANHSFKAVELKSVQK